MNDNATITLLVSAKSGALASIIVKVSKLGLRYKKNLNDNLTDPSRLILYFEGSLTCSKDELIKTLEENQHVDVVEKVEISNEAAYTNNSIKAPKVEITQPTKIENTKKIPTAPNPTARLNGKDPVNAEAIKIAEEYLTPDFGIVAPLLVETAAKENSHIAGMFLDLSNELESNMRADFLALVSDIKEPA